MSDNKQYVDLYTTKTCGVDLVYYENNKRYTKHIKYDWYFYVSTIDFETNKARFEKFKIHNPSCNVRYEKENDNWTKIYSNYPAKYRKTTINFVKNMKIKSYEADLSLVRRYWLDSNLRIAEPEHYKLLFVDIEVDDSVDGLRIGADTILSFAATDSDGKIYFIADKNEEVLIRKAIRLMKRYDISIGWNSQKYDIPYIKKRCEKYNIEFPDICHVDAMQRMIHAYRFDTNIKSFSLDSIAKHFLDDKKIERDTKIIDLYNDDFELFKKYNIHDTVLLYKLDKQFDVIQMLLKQAYWCNVTPRSLGQGGGGLYTLLDTLILKEAHTRDIKGPSPKYTFDELHDMKKEDLKKLDYPGGLVLDPALGLYKNVYIFDFKTLYPSIVLSSNIGFDTLSKDGDIKNPSGSRFKSTPKSVLSVVLTELLTKRKVYKDKKLQMIEDGKKGTPAYGAVEADEVVVKELANSVYGICGAKWGRYFASREVVESITLMGQWLLLSLKDFFSTKDCKILMGDTDSIVISTEENIDINETLKEYHAYLGKRLLDECNISKFTIQLAFDKSFEKIVIVAKKNYAGYVTNQEGRKADYLHVRGLASVKSDTCKLVASTVKELIHSLLKTDNDANFYIKWLTEKGKTIFNDITVDDISIHKKIRRRLSEYKSMPLSAHIAQKYADKDGNLLRNEITYVVTGRDMTTHKLTGVRIDEYDGHFDASYYWDNLIFPNATRLLKVSFPAIDWDYFKYETITRRTLL